MGCGVIYIYRSDKSEGAHALVQSLRDEGKRLTANTWYRTGFNPGDIVVCWGARIGQAIPGVKVLNDAPWLDKFEQIKLFTRHKIPTVTAQRQEPEDTEGWLPRRFEHEDGNDLLKRVARPDFWVKFEKIQNEYRVHSFMGESIRAGRRVKDSPDAHPWIRTYHAGWKISCDGFRSTSRMREIAHAAVKVLGLEFGAVDIGERRDGSLFVLEVNRSPGIENENTMPAYAEALKELV
jgi:hypothetical protein